MIQFLTRNSCYELDPENKRIRFVSGSFPPTRHVSPAGEWHEYLAAGELRVGECFNLRWPDMYYWHTSTVSHIEGVL